MSFGPAQGGGGGGATFTGGSITNPLRLPDGTVVAPALAFTSELGLGLWRAATGNTHFTRNGVDQFLFDSASDQNILNVTRGGAATTPSVKLGLTYLTEDGTGQIDIGTNAGLSDGTLSTGIILLAGQLNTRVIQASGSFTSTSGSANFASLTGNFSDGAVNSTTTPVGLLVNPTINYTGAARTGHYEVLSIQAIETSLPSGTNYLIRASAGAAGTTDKFTVDNTGQTIVTSTADVPLSVSTTSSTSGGRVAGFSCPVTLTTGAKWQVLIQDTTPLAAGVGGGLVLMGNVQPGINAPLVSVYASKTNATDNDRNAYLVVAPNNNVAGGVNNCVATLGVSDLFVKVNSGVLLGWTSNATNVTTTALDTALSRDSAGVIDFGTGAAGSTAGSWKATNGTLTGSLTTPTVTAAVGMTISTSSGNNLQITTPSASVLATTTALTINAGGSNIFSLNPSLSTLYQASGAILGWSSATATSGSVDLALTRVSTSKLAIGSGAASNSAADLVVSGSAATHAESMTISSASELLTLSTSGTTTDTSANLLPAGAIIMAVTCRITTTITTATNWSVGDATTAARFSASNSTLTSGTTSVGLEQFGGSGAAGAKQNAAAKVRITTTGTPGAGAIRITVHYIQMTAATS